MVNPRTRFFGGLGALILAGTFVPAPLTVPTAADGAVTLVADINLQPPAAATPSEVAGFGGTVIYAGEETVHGKELWKVDPVSREGVFVRDIRPGGQSSSPADITVAGALAHFVADDGVHGRELWKTDGTSGGTTIVKDINPGTSGSGPVRLVNVGGTLYLEANDGVHGRELCAVRRMQISYGTET